MRAILDFVSNLSRFAEAVRYARRDVTPGSFRSYTLVWEESNSGEYRYTPAALTVIGKKDGTDCEWIVAGHAKSGDTDPARFEILQWSKPFNEKMCGYINNIGTNQQITDLHNNGKTFHEYAAFLRAQAPHYQRRQFRSEPQVAGFFKWLDQQPGISDLNIPEYWLKQTPVPFVPTQKAERQPAPSNS
jgi:hypothetical protein